jgi:acetoin utilization protein AcuB
MQVAAVMKHPVRTVRPLDSVAHARALMEEYRVNQLPVTVNGRVVGIVSDRDLRDAFPSVFEQGAVAHDPHRVAVEAVMTTHVLTTEPHASLAAVARMMRRERIGAVPVVDAGRLLGIVARSDVLDVVAASEHEPSHATVV